MAETETAPAALTDDTPSNPPNQTLYVRNLNEKVKKEELKKSLYELFSQYGPILDVVAYKTLKMRGQAFIVFKDVASSTNAMRQLQGFPFYDKPMNIQYAKGKSFAVGKLDGTYGDLKRQRDEERVKEAAQPKKPKQRKTEPGTQAAPQIKDENLPPNKILFVQNMSPDTTETTLTALFSQFPGFREVRLVPGRTDICFIEFENEMVSAVAKDNLQNYRIGPTHYIRITFARQ